MQESDHSLMDLLNQFCAGYQADQCLQLSDEQCPADWSVRGYKAHDSQNWSTCTPKQQLSFRNKPPMVPHNQPMLMLLKWWSDIYWSLWCSPVMVWIPKSSVMGPITHNYHTVFVNVRYASDPPLNYITTDCRCQEVWFYPDHFVKRLLKHLI